jgi:hypothetical protein
MLQPLLQPACSMKAPITQHCPRASSRLRKKVEHLLRLCCGAGLTVLHKTVAAEHRKCLPSKEALAVAVQWGQCSGAIFALPLLHPRRKFCAA